jgi:hypothetical protein
MRIPLKSAGPAACDCAAGPHQFALSLAANFCQPIVPSTFRGEVNSLRMHSELMSRSFSERKFVFLIRPRRQRRLVHPKPDIARACYFLTGRLIPQWASDGEASARRDGIAALPPSVRMLR